MEFWIFGKINDFFATWVTTSFGTIYLCLFQAWMTQSRINLREIYQRKELITDHFYLYLGLFDLKSNFSKNWPVLFGIALIEIGGSTAVIWYATRDYAWIIVYCLTIVLTTIIILYIYSNMMKNRKNRLSRGIARRFKELKQT